MSNDTKLDQERRVLLIATGVAAGIPAVSMVGSMVGSLAPSARAKAAGAPIEVDIADLAPGQMKTVEWRGKPVWILKRTPDMLASLETVTGQLADPDSERNKEEMTPAYARNAHRSIKPDILVAIGICTHLGCSPIDKFKTGAQPSLPDDWTGGFLCPCHGSTFDLAGRVFQNKPAPDNLQIPRHMYASETRLVIGKDEQGEA